MVAQSGTGVTTGVNQIMEVFKIQSIMKFIDSGSSGHKSLLTILFLLGYDQLVKYIPAMLQFFVTWFENSVYSKQEDKQPLLLQSPDSITKSIKAYIQFERALDGKLSDPRIDAVLHHVCNLPEVRSLRYNGIEMIPYFKDALLIENDIWFELSATHTTSSSPSSSGPKQEPILYRLSTYEHDITWLHRFVERAIETFEQEKRNRLGCEQYYFDMIGSNSGQYKHVMMQNIVSFTKSKFTSNRSLQNIYLRQIDDLKQRVDFFLKRRNWYDAKGIPHTLGIVMYGVPGCGKTSTIKAIANETKRHVFNLLLSEIKTKDALKELFYNDQVNVVIDGKLEVLNIPLKQRLYVIEDIDAMNSVVLKRSPEQIQKEEEYKLKLDAEIELLKQTQGEVMARSMIKGKEDGSVDKLDLATLLNVLDGVRETPGRIIILSTNYPERLDEALLRPGRFDMMLEFEKHSCTVLHQHLEKHYDAELTKAQEELIHSSSLEKKWTPAEVSQILFRRIGDLEGAIQDLCKEDPVKLFKFSQTEKSEKSEFQSTELSELLKTDESVIQQVNEPVIQQVNTEIEKHRKKEKPTEKEVFEHCTFSEQSILFGIHADMGFLSANDTGFPVVKKADNYPTIELIKFETTTGNQSDEIQNFKLPKEILGSIPAEFFGIAAFNEGPEPSLDDFFPNDT